MLVIGNNPRAVQYDPPQWEALKSLVLDSVGSEHTKRAYATAISEFLVWYRAELRPPFSKAIVHAHRTYLIEERGLSPASINVRISALRKLATEAGDNGLMSLLPNLPPGSHASGESRTKASGWGTG